ncbi:hypothetical protein HK096_001970 [Nowakowskiella sp. JEL0078]|nr:hypothetical protein HK096_001970 [Nowakowskiella sp. JEL0078]
MGPSMLPTFSIFGDVVLVERLSPSSRAVTSSTNFPRTLHTAGSMMPAESQSMFSMLFRKKVSVGDIVIFVSPLNPSRTVCKRIVGLPGDTVCVNPEKLSKSNDNEAEYLVIPEGHMWALGDNLENSTDSRMYGPVPMGLIRGRVRFKVFPFFKAF